MQSKLAIAGALNVKSHTMSPVEVKFILKNLGAVKSVEMSPAKELLS
jgi:hypothetical protein